MSDMTSGSGRLVTFEPRIDFTLLGLCRAVISLYDPPFISGSSGLHFGGVGFGRDQEEVGFGLYPWLPSTAGKAIYSISQTMSLGRREVADAKRSGQVAHEFHTTFKGPLVSSEERISVANDIGARWGGLPNSEEQKQVFVEAGFSVIPDYQRVVQYGSADATPKLVRLVYLATQDPRSEVSLDDWMQLLEDGSVIQLREVVRNAAEWTMAEIAESQANGGQPLLGFLRTNKQYGHRWQIPADGGASVTFPDGHLANSDDRVETIDLQADAHSCLVYAYELLKDEYPEEAISWLNQAKQLQQATLSEFWMDDEQYFAMFRDRDADGNPRVGKTLSYMPAALLRSTIFDDLPDEERQKYVGGIVRMLFSPEFMTPAGVRCLARRHGNLPYPNYWGVHLVWAVVQKILAEGLHYQRLERLAMSIRYQSFNSLHVSGDGFEFQYVDLDGRVRYFIAPVNPNSRPEDVMVGTNLPDAG